MYRLAIGAAIGASLCVPVLAYAQTKTVTLNGLQADVAVVPNDDLSRTMVGQSKDEVLDLVRKAAPAVITRPAAVPPADKLAQ